MRRAASAPKRATSRKTARAVAKTERRTARRQATRRLPAKTEMVALRREIDIPSTTGSVDRSGAVAAPTGSIPSMVTQAARQAGVSPALAHAVVKVESRYEPRATGPGGYIGLMQLSYQTARGMGFRGSRQALYEPSTNLRYGMKYLAGAVAKSGGSTCGAVSKYQGGHGVRGVTRAGAVYCAKVKRFMAQGLPAGERVTAEATADKPKS
ncbi:lytic transglycosylase domain-containing protein [Methylopila henanensis]|uniref:Lytic transglycosylase domain-containing protein n=1 Tax=Methylopila henanensis TaxID=873516 RepID=A0ABW4K6D2_9HYPH